MKMVSNAYLHSRLSRSLPARNHLDEGFSNCTTPSSAVNHGHSLSSPAKLGLLRSSWLIDGRTLQIVRLSCSSGAACRFLSTKVAILADFKCRGKSAPVFNISLSLTTTELTVKHTRG